MSNDYSSAWYQKRITGSRDSAHVVLPLVFDIVRPTSVVDVGCGTGSWLRVASELGVDDVIGIDAPHLHTTLLEMERTRFVAHDLSQPLDLGRSFDLALCLEVGEHLERRSASTLVETLTALAPAVLFSAAVPGQGGTAHVNEQWPAYWARLFAERGYHAHDVVRATVWRDGRVKYFYAQNTILYVSEDRAAQYDGLPAAIVGEPLSLVHPRLFERALRQLPGTDRIDGRMALEFVGRLIQKVGHAARSWLRGS